MVIKNPTLTCLVQTYRNNIAEQLKQIKDSLRGISGVNIISSQPVLGNFGLLLELEGSMENLFKALERLKSLKFIQHIATFLPPSEQIVPDKIGKNKVSQDAKVEIVTYLQEIQGPIIEGFEDLKRQIDVILVQSQRSVAQKSDEIMGANVRQAIDQLDRGLFLRRINRLEERVRSLEISMGRSEGRREQARETRTFGLQETQVSLKRRHIAVLVLALVFSLMSLLSEVYKIFFP